MVVLKRTPQAVAQQVEVDTDIYGACLFPSYILVWRSEDGTGVAEVAGIVLRSHVGSSVAPDVTADTVGCTELEVVDPVDFTEEVLAVHVPARTYRPDRLVLEFGACAPKVGAVPTEASGDVVLVVKRIGGVTVEGYEAVGYLAQGLVVLQREVLHAEQRGEVVAQGLLVVGLPGEQFGVVSEVGVVGICDTAVTELLAYEDEEVVTVGETAIEVELLTEVVATLLHGCLVHYVAFGKVVLQVAVGVLGHEIVEE